MEECGKRGRVCKNLNQRKSHEEVEYNQNQGNTDSVNQVIVAMLGSKPNIYIYEVSVCGKLREKAWSHQLYLKRKANQHM